MLNHLLWSTDAAPEVPHPRPTRRDVATRRGRRCPCVQPRPATWIPRAFRRLAPTLADAASTRADSLGIGPTWAWIGLNRPYRLYRPKRPSQAEIKKKKKKKKGAERTVWLISKPYFSLISHTRHTLSSSPHIDLDDDKVGVWLSCWLSYWLSFI